MSQEQEIELGMCTAKTISLNHIHCISYVFHSIEKTLAGKRYRPLTIRPKHLTSKLICIVPVRKFETHVRFLGLKISIFLVDKNNKTEIGASQLDHPIIPSGRIAYAGFTLRPGKRFFNRVYPQ